MNAKQKNFITKKLIPFILREQGRGFGMTYWNTEEDCETEAGDIFSIDGLSRKVPVCGTVCCIGGSIEHLMGRRAIASKILGLTRNQVQGLFYNWEEEFPNDGLFGWPEKFAKQFEARKSPLGKAKVAVALLKEVVRTNGKCLNPKTPKERGNF
jgi:hypothetical protein